MPIQAIIFDFGGVLIHTEDRSEHQKWEKRLGLPEGELTDEMIIAAEEHIKEPDSHINEPRNLSTKRSASRRFISN